ncbi:MAG: hypothetical protein ACR2IF_07260 [Terriglobales bacterium]
MRNLSQSELLDVWERGLDQSQIERVLSLVGAVETEAERFTWGECVATLFRLSEQTFGEQITGIATCPSCSHDLEVSFTVPSEFPPAHPTALSVTCGGFIASFRLPTLVDLLTAGDAADAYSAERALLRRCVTTASAPSGPVASDELPADVVSAISEAMAEADPHAEVTLPVVCANCRHAWTADFDIASFLWSEVQARAVHTLRDVHRLAAAYGWSEGAILEMSPARRRVYLELIAE